MDETSFRRGQDSVSVLASLDQARVVFATPGGDAGAYARFAEDLACHGGSAEQVTDSRISNGLLEGLHSLAQAAKRRARGHRSPCNYNAMIHLTAGKLDVAVTHSK